MNKPTRIVPTASFLRTAFLLLAVAGLCSAASAEYKLVARFPVPDGGGENEIGWFDVDQANRHLFIAHTDAFDALDADSGKKVGEIAPATKAHHVASAPEFNRGFATSGDMGVIMFDLKTLKQLSVIKTNGENPNDIVYDPDTKRIYVGNSESGTVAVIDPRTGEVVGMVTIANDPNTLENGEKVSSARGIAFDGSGRAFVKDPGERTVVVFDTHTLKVLGRWPTSQAPQGVLLQIDLEHHRLFSTCKNNILDVFDTDSGKVIATPAIGKDPDRIYFVPKTQQIVTVNHDHTFTVLHEDAPDTYSLVQTAPTNVRDVIAANKGAYDFEKGRILINAWKYGPAPASAKEKPILAGSNVVLVFEE